VSPKICTTVPKGHTEFTEINCPKHPSQQIHVPGIRFSQTPKITNSHPRNSMVPNSQDNASTSRNPEDPNPKINLFIIKHTRLLLYFRIVLYSIPIQFCKLELESIVAQQPPHRCIFLFIFEHLILFQNYWTCPNMPHVYVCVPLHARKSNVF